jgi:chaperonin cofactor prefoldin
MDISDSTVAGAIATLLGTIGTLGGIIYRTLSNSITALEKRVTHTEAKADACERDREELRDQIDQLDRAITRCPSAACPLRR